MPPDRVESTWQQITAAAKAVCQQHCLPFPDNLDRVSGDWYLRRLGRLKAVAELLEQLAALEPAADPEAAKKPANAKTTKPAPAKSGSTAKTAAKQEKK